MEIRRIAVGDLAAWMPARERRERRVLVLGGNWMDHRDPVLAGKAALYSGVEEVFLAVPGKIADSVRCLSPDLSVVPLPDQKLTRGAAAWILGHVRELDAAYLGAGFKDAGGAVHLARELAAGGTGLVLGSDGARREVLGVLRGARAVAIYDEVEFGREFGAWSGELGDEEAAERLRRAAADVGCAIAMTGRYGMASDGADVFACTPGLRAKPAGMDSIVGGLAAGLMAMGLDGSRAAAAAIYIVELAADSLSERRGLHWGASELLEELPGVLLKFDYLRS
ncbi:MAG: NAD(P)H-hydrate dehydratase [Conexivisphaera sp.]